MSYPIVALAALGVLTLGAMPVVAQDIPANGIHSEVIETVPGSEQALRQSLVLDANIADVWDLFATDEGVQQWMAPVGQVDLRAGGAIRTHYDPCMEPGDVGTITNRIVNFVPQRLLTLQSDLAPQRDAAWMNETIYAARENLYAVIEFETLGKNRTRVTMWGLGYGQGEEWDTIIGFFIAGNEWTFGQLQKAIAGQTVYPQSCRPEAP